jgi:hypothetical protein
VKQNVETDMITTMRTIVLGLSLVALAAPSVQAAPRAQSRNDDVSQQQRCRDMVGKETGEGEGRGHAGHFQAQRFSDCMMGVGQ